MEEAPVTLPPRRNSGSILESAEIKLILKALYKNWWIFLLLSGIGYIIGYYYAYKLPDVYEAETQLLFKPYDQINSSSIITPNYGVFGSYQSYVDNYNEMRVIQSYDLIKSVVQKLNVNVSYFIDGRLKQSEVSAAVPFRVTEFYINGAFYDKEIDIKILDKNHFNISYLKGDKVYSQNGTFGDDFINHDMKIQVNTTFDLDPSSIEALKTIKYFFQIHSTESLISNFRYSLSVKNPDYTNIIEVSMRDFIPARAISFLDTLDKLYIENTVNTQFKINANTLLYIDREMNEVSNILDTVEIALENYKEKKNILSTVEKDEADYFDTYTKSTEAKTKVLLELGALSDLEQYVIEGKDPEFLPSSVYLASTDPLLQSMTNQLYSTQLKIIGASDANTNQSPGILAAKEQIKRITEDMLIYINNTRKALTDKLANVDSTINSTVNDIHKLPEKQRGYTNIKRQEDINTRLYEFLLDKRASTILEKAAIIPSTKVIEKARSMGVVEPNRNRIHTFYAACGAAIAAFILLIRLLFFDRIENIQELKSKTSLPVLGEILSAPTLTDLSFAIEDNPKSPLTESFRTLRTNLQYMFTEPDQKTILFTSNGPSEGKTFCSMNMAAMLAKAEKKVLLLEFDLHKPRMHKVLNVIPDKGLSTLLIRKNTIEESIVPSPIHGLDIILCGPVPPNSSELVLSSRVKELIDWGKEHYDYVVIDTPPIGFISDALILMKLSDVNLFVLNTKFAYRESINYVQEIVYNNKIQNFGFVLNNVKRKKSKYYYRRYSYYGGYGYGYGGGYGSYGS